MPHTSVIFSWQICSEGSQLPYKQSLWPEAPYCKEAQTSSGKENKETLKPNEERERVRKRGRNGEREEGS